jgi:hypothetical protein
MVAPIVKMAAVYGFCFALGFAASVYLEWSTRSALLLGYALTYLDPARKRGGYPWPAFQRLSLWQVVSRYLSASVTVETPFSPDGQYIMGCFPHGACSVQHVLTMTDTCGFLTRTMTVDRRDLAATVLFFIPVLREMLLWYEDCITLQWSAITSSIAGVCVLTMCCGLRADMFISGWVVSMRIQRLHDTTYVKVEAC